MSNNNHDLGDYQRPRRPNEDTLTYLKSLPLDLKISNQQVQNFLDKSDYDKTNNDDDNYPALFAAALQAISEVQLELASLAGHEDGAACIETIAQMTMPFSELATRQLLNGCLGYAVHLSTHRYGSHVLQTLLQLANTQATGSSQEDLAKLVLAEDDNQFASLDQSLPSLQDLLLNFAQELTPYTSQLAVHICGSHVLRTLVCVLAGIDLQSSGNFSSEQSQQQPQRGRKKSKKKKRKPSEDNNPQQQASHPGVMHMVYLPQQQLRVNVSLIESTCQEALEEIANVFIAPYYQQHNGKPGTLQQLASHASASPFLIILLRVLTYTSCPEKEQQTWQSAENNSATNNARQLGLLQKQPQFQLNSTAHHLAQAILCWPLNDDNDNNEETTMTSNVIYGLAGEPRGSHVLETLLRISPESFYLLLIQYADLLTKTTLEDYVKDNVSNYIVQTLLQTLPTKDLAEQVLTNLTPLVQTGFLLDSSNHRRGIVWRAVECAAQHRVGQDALLKAIKLGYAALHKNNDDAANDKNIDNMHQQQDNNNKKKKKKQRHKASVVDMTAIVPFVLSPQINEKDDRLTVDAAGARTLYHLLRFAPRLCQETLEAILALDATMLQKAAQDGLASRCLWDGILESPHLSSSQFQTVLPKLYHKLSTQQWIALASDRVGHHVVIKLFLSLSQNMQLEWAQSLASHIPRLSGSAMGRQVLDKCGVRAVSQGLEAWKQAVKQANFNGDEWLEEVLDTATASSSSAGKNNKKKKKNRKRQADTDLEKSPNKVAKQ